MITFSRLSSCCWGREGRPSREGQEGEREKVGLEEAAGGGATKGQRTEDEGRHRAQGKPHRQTERGRWEPGRAAGRGGRVEA